MGIFRNKKEWVYPFSGFDGQVLYKGQPAAGAKLIRNYDMFGDTFEETITADNDGRFTFDSIQAEFRKPLIPVIDFLVHQDIYIEYKNEKYHVYTSAKWEKEEYSEFGSATVHVLCELTEEPRVISREDREGMMVTSFHWNNKVSEQK